MITINKIKIVEYQNWKNFLSTIRKVSLLGDNHIYPYQNAQIYSKIVAVSSVKPISLYLLKSHLEILDNLREILLKDYRIDILNLNSKHSDISYHVDNHPKLWKMSPPIVEESEIDGGIPLLIDGEHRFMLAKRLNLAIRVVWIQGVSKQIPTVAKPIDWEKVKICNQTPETAKKRSYRFDSITDFPDISSFSRTVISKDNYRYFFYRNLTPICTSNIRNEGGKK